MIKAHDDEELSARLAYFAERVDLVFSYFFYKIEFEGDEDLSANPVKNARAWGLMTIHNACLHTTLIALRDLDDFLRPRTPHSKPDDLKASDFGFRERANFLSRSEREAINKRIAHSTSPGFSDYRAPWDTFELATKGISQALKFLEWVQKNFGTHFFTSNEAHIHANKIREIYNYVKGHRGKRPVDA